jgi:multidrug resistance efflux pump
MMVFLLASYMALLALFVWLRFVPWNTFWKLSPILVLIALNIGLFIPMGWGAPSGPALVIRNAVQIIPNVAGPVVEVSVRPNAPLKAGDVLFRIDPAPFAFKVQDLKAQLVGAEQKAKQLQADLDAAEANVAAIASQLSFAEKRRDDIARLARTNATSEFRLQDEEKQVETLTAQLAAAKAQDNRARLALASEIDGVNTDVARLRADLGGAEWELAQTTVRAPADGYVTNLALRAGARATTSAPVMAFIETSAPIIGVEIAQIDARHVAVGQPVEVTFKTRPGTIYTGRVEAVLQAIASGQTQVSGLAVAPGEVRAAPFLVRIALDDGEVAARLPAGSTGTAAIFTEHVKVSHVIRRVILRQVAILNYVNPF